MKEGSVHMLRPHEVERWGILCDLAVENVSSSVVTKITKNNYYLKIQDNNGTTSPFLIIKIINIHQKHGTLFGRALLGSLGLVCSFWEEINRHNHDSYRVAYPDFLRARIFE